MRPLPCDFKSAWRLVALLELRKIRFRADNVGFARASERKQLTLAAKIKRRGLELRLVIIFFRALRGGAGLGERGCRCVHFWLARLSGRETCFL